MRPGSPGLAAAAAYAAAHDGLSLIVLRDGAVLREQTADQPFETASGTKSFIGVMAAVAVADGVLSLDAPVAEVLPEWASDPVKSAVTVRHLLSLTAGLPSVIGQVPTYAAALDMPFNAPPGQRFQYGPAPYQVFGEILRRRLVAAGHDSDPLAWFAARLLTPLGLDVSGWRRGPDGLPLLPQGAVISARDWARFGEFVRGGGRLNGEAVVDAAAFAEQFVGSTANPAYGLTWWLPRPSDSPDVVTASSDLARHARDLPGDLVMASGAGDQKLYVIPSLGLTVARHAVLDVAKLMRRMQSGERDPDGWSDFAFLSLLLGL